MTGIALGISASGGAFRAALRDSDGRVHEARRDAAEGASARPDLAPLVAALFAEHGIAKDRLAEVRLDVGPGSYTGLRVAVTFARTLAAFAGPRVTTVTSCELLGIAGARAGLLAPGRPFSVVLDARRDRCYWARLQLLDRLRLLVAPSARPPDEVRGALAAGEAVLTALGAAAALEHEPPPVPLDWPRASLLFDPALDPVQAEVEDLAPLYLMGSYAE